ncbi:hypothetical protein NDU88_008939 [Pleurodeles waltl]|uniref:Uncharacterized protein n=1 Tax=Pleurodeles waltl TaxID=8319 RepID=A0AAV7PXL9_PLEWA|nr:hypothetical protein NDU88_008939 [Pleurodeles waltl]
MDGRRHGLLIRRAYAKRPVDERAVARWSVALQEWEKICSLEWVETGVECCIAASPHGHAMQSVAGTQKLTKGLSRERMSVKRPAAALGLAAELSRCTRCALASCTEAPPGCPESCR